MDARGVFEEFLFKGNCLFCVVYHKLNFCKRRWIVFGDVFTGNQTMTYQDASRFGGMAHAQTKSSYHEGRRSKE
jgi:hypothetical protein